MGSIRIIDISVLFLLHYWHLAGSIVFIICQFCGMIALWNMDPTHTSLTCFPVPVYLFIFVDDGCCIMY